MSLPKVLVVDDEPSILNALQRQLRHEKIQLTITSSPFEALRLVEKEHFTIIISDQRMPSMEGTKLLERVRDISPDTIRIILTGYADIKAASTSINHCQVFKFLSKPWEDDELKSAIHEAVSTYHKNVENAESQKKK